MIQADSSDVMMTSLKLSHRENGVLVVGVHLCGCPRNRPIRTQRVNYEHTKREYINGFVILWLLHEGFRRHVAESAWGLGLRDAGLLGGADVQHFGHAEIRDLGLQGRGEEDVIGGQIAVDDGRRLLVHVAQTESHVGENVVVHRSLRHSVLLQVAGQGDVQVLHDEVR